MTNILPIDKIQTLTSFIVAESRVNHNPVTLIDVSAILIQYESIFHGGVASMYNFLEWCRNNGQEDSYILANIMHDLNGRNEPFFSPRTGSY